MKRLRSSHKWRQSNVARMLSCPRRFYLEFVACLPPDHRLSGYAGLLGTADHAGIETILHGVNEGRTPTRAQLRDRVMAAFREAVIEAQEKGEHTDDEGVDRACDQLEGVRLDRLEALANDDRVHAIEWRGIEEPFEFTNRGTDSRGRAWRRNWKGTIDGWGIARRYVAEFGADGREPVEIQRGEAICVDWKTGVMTQLGHTARRLNVQLAIYAMTLSRGHPVPWRMFLGNVVDFDMPKSPNDENGDNIPKWAPKEINPAFLARLDESERASADKSRRKPRDENKKSIPKWLPEALNPAFVAATSKPKGPFFHEAPIVWPVVLETIKAAIRQAEAGLFPAAGAATGQCKFCPYSGVCADADTADTTDADTTDTETGDPK